MKKHLLIFMTLIASLSTSFAQDNIDSLRLVYSRTPNISSNYDLVFKLGNYYCFQDIDSATFFANQLISSTKKSKNDYWKANGLFLFARINLMIDDYETGERYAQKALSIARKNEYWDIASHTYHLLAMLKYYQSEYQKGLVMIDTAMTILEKYDHPNMVSKERLLSGTCLIQSQMGLYKKAIETYYDILREIEPQGNTQFLSTTYGNMAGLYAKKEDYKTAIKYFKKAIGISKAINSSFGVGVASINLSSTYFSIAQYDSASYYSQQGIEELEKVGEKGHVAQGLIIQARIDFQKEKYGTALEKSKESYQRFSMLNNPIGKAESANLISDIYLKLKQNTEAKRYIDTAYSIVSMTNERPQLRDSYERYYKYYKAVGNLSNALDYYEKYIVLKDSLETESNRLKLEELKEIFEGEKKDLKIKIITSQRDKILVGLIAFLLLSIIISLAAWQIRKKNKKLLIANHTVTKLNSELFSKNQQLHEINQYEIAKNIMLIVQIDELITVNEQTITEKKGLALDITSLEDERKRLNQEKSNLIRLNQDIEADKDKLVREQQEIERQRNELAMENEILRKQNHLLKPIDKYITVVKKSPKGELKKAERFPIWTGEVIYISSNGNYSEFYNSELLGEKRITFIKLLEDLPEHFCKVHKSHIVNVKLVTYEKNSDRVKVGTRGLPVTQKSELWAKFAKYNGLNP